MYECGMPMSAGLCGWRFRKVRRGIRMGVMAMAMRGERGGRWNAMHRQVARCE